MKGQLIKGTTPVQNEYDLYVHLTAMNKAPTKQNAVQRLHIKQILSIQRKRIWRAAHIPFSGGWNRDNRLARYLLLKAITK
jgi:hypothetical protein